jgi:hypothetical protein
LAYDDPGLYKTSVPAAQHPLRVKWVYGVGCAAATKPAWAPTPVHAADILIVDANDQTVFDSTKLVPVDGDSTYQQFQKRSWSADYDIYQWIGNAAVCRIVVYKTWPPTDEMPPKNWPVHFAPGSAVLDERAVTKMPKRLRSLRVKNGAATLGIVRRAGVTFAAGNNMVLSSANAATTLRKDTQVVFTVTPGAGAGRYNDCATEPAPPIYAINGVTPNKFGDFTISAGDCLWARTPTTIVSPGIVTPVTASGAPIITVGSNCPACCDCPDYREAALYMNRVRDRYKIIGARAHQAKMLHENNIERWTLQRDCRLQKPLRVILTPQFCPILDVVLMYCNQCQQCASNVTLNAAFAVYPATTNAEIVCGYTTLSAPGVNGRAFSVAGAWPNFSASLPPIDVGNSAYVKFRLRFTPHEYPYSVSVNLTGTNGGAAVLAGCTSDAAAAYGSDSVALNCDENGNTPECQ